MYQYKNNFAFFKFQKIKYLNLAGEWEEMDIEIKFMKYGTKTKGRDKSGAYLFLPESDAKVI